MKKGNPKTQNSENGDRSWAAGRKSSNTWKLARDIGMAKNGMVVKEGRIRLKDCLKNVVFQQLGLAEGGKNGS